MTRKQAGRFTLLVIAVCLLSIGYWGSLKIAEGDIEEKFHWAAGLNQTEERETEPGGLFIEAENPILYIILVMCLLAVGIGIGVYSTSRKKG